MSDINNTSTEGTQTSTEGMQQGKTVTQDDVNRIVQDRLAKEKGKVDAEIAKRTAELDKRERRMNAVQKLRDSGLPDYLVDALNMDTDEAFEQSLEAIRKMKGETTVSQQKEEGAIIGYGNPIGVVNKGHGPDDLRLAFGLR